MADISPAAQAVKRNLAQIMQELSKYCRISISATDAVPITLETTDASLEAGINALCAAALRACADQVVPPCSTQSDRGTQRMMIRHELLAIAAELKGRQAELPRRHVFPTPHQIAECGGPCEQGGPEACDCGLYERSSTKSTH